MMAQRKIKVLIADDNKDFCKLISDVMSIQSDIAVEAVANDGVEALKLIKEKAPDIAILDIIMPRLDGLGVLESLYSLGNRHRVPRTIVLSAIGQNRLTQRALSLGADYYIVKPFEIESFMNRIRNLYNSTVLNEQKEAGGCTLNKAIEAKGPDLYDFSNLDKQIGELLRQLSIPSNIKGYKYIKEALSMYAMSEGMIAIVKELYSAIAEKYNSTAYGVERSIRHAIAIAYERGKADLIRKISGGSIQSQDKRPSNGLFIASLADMLRLSNRVLH